MVGQATAADAPPKSISDLVRSQLPKSSMWRSPGVMRVAYGTELVNELIESRISGRLPRYSGSIVNLAEFLLPAHIAGLAVGMLLYAAENVAAIAFAASIAVGSKYMFRMVVGVSRNGHPV